MFALCTDGHPSTMHVGKYTSNTRIPDTIRLHQELSTRNGAKFFPPPRGEKKGGHIPDKNQAGKCDVPMWVFTVSVLFFGPENGRSFSAFNLCSQKNRSLHVSEFVMKDERRRLASVLPPSPHVTTVTGGRLSDGSLQSTECIGHGGLLSGSMLWSPRH